MNISLVSLQVLFPLELLSAGIAPEWPGCLLSQVNNFVVPGKPLLSGEELIASLHLATMHWFVCVLLCVSLQMFFPCESLFASTTVIHSF